MTKKTFLGAMTVVAAVALTGSALVASNMGFKLNYQLLQTTGGVSSDGTSVLALPDNRQTGLNDAKNLMDDIGFANILSVQKFIRVDNSLQSYTGRKNSLAAFPLVAGDGYRVKMQTTVNYIIVGSDNPTIAYDLRGPVVGVVSDGTSEYAYNYHQTATDSKALMDDIGFANILSVQRFVKLDNSLVSYTGRKNSIAAFPLTPGESYRVKMQTTVNYIPSHY